MSDWGWSFTLLIITSYLKHLTTVELGYVGLANDWFRSYLKGRQQMISISNQVSTIKEIASWVPQRSVLVPLVFLIFINDLHSCLKYSKASQCADDTNITLSQFAGNSSKENESWSQKTLNVAKSNNIEKKGPAVFGRQNIKSNSSFKIKLDEKRPFPTISVKYFGLLLDEHLTWSPQQYNCNTQQGKVPSELSYTQNGIPFSLCNSSSLCLLVMGSKQ